MIPCGHFPFSSLFQSQDLEYSIYFHSTMPLYPKLTLSWVFGTCVGSINVGWRSKGLCSQMLPLQASNICFPTGQHPIHQSLFPLWILGAWHAQAVPILTGCCTLWSVIGGTSVGALTLFLLLLKDLHANRLLYSTEYPQSSFYPLHLRRCRTVKLREKKNSPVVPSLGNSGGLWSRGLSHRIHTIMLWFIMV